MLAVFQMRPQVSDKGSNFKYLKTQIENEEHPNEGQRCANTHQNYYNYINYRGKKPDYHAYKEECIELLRIFICPPNSKRAGTQRKQKQE
jgi:hypothetical protein